MARLIGTRKVPTTSDGGGVWNLNDQAKFRKDGIWPVFFTGARYWRLYITESHYGNASVIIFEVALRSSTGGSNEASGKTVTASQSHLPAGNVIDGSLTTFWQAYNGGASVLPAWIQFDLTNAINIVEYAISSGSEQSNVLPKAWALQYSDNATDWTTVDTVSNEASWSNNQTRTYTVG